MCTSSSLRLMSDLKTMKQNPPEGVSASPLGDENLHVWGGTIFGTDDTAWEGGIFSMRMTFPEQYPDKPPRVRFTSEMVRSPSASHLAMCSALCSLPRPPSRRDGLGWDRSKSLMAWPCSSARRAVPRACGVRVLAPMAKPASDLTLGPRVSCSPSFRSSTRTSTPTGRYAWISSRTTGVPFTPFAPS